MALIDDKIILIESAEELFKDGLLGADAKLIDELKKLYTQFLQGGKLQFDALKLAELDSLIIEVIGLTDYRKITNAYLQNFEGIEEINKQIMKSVNGLSTELTGIALAENERIINNVEKVATQLRGSNSGLLTVKELVDGKIVTRQIPYGNPSLDQLIAPLSDIMKEDIISGVSFESASERITQTIQKKELGLSRWAGQISRDALSQQDGLINNELRIEFGLDWITYAGTMKDTTRPFCYHMLTEAKQIPYEDLAPILNEFIPNGVPSETSTNKTPTGKEKAKGSGMIPGTDESNFTIRRGGYNCRHIVIPTFAP